MTTKREMDNYTFSTTEHEVISLCEVKGTNFKVQTSLYRSNVQVIFHIFDTEPIVYIFGVINTHCKCQMPEILHISTIFN